MLKRNTIINDNALEDDGKSSAEMNSMDNHNPLLDIQPEQWNNIPFCLINAVKLLVSDALADEGKLEEFIARMEQKIKRLNSAMLRQEKDLSRKEEQTEIKIDRVEKNLTDAFIVLKKQLEDKMHTTMFHTDEMMANINAAVRARPLLLTPSRR